MKRTSLTFNVTSPQSQLPSSSITSISPPLIKVQKRKQNPKVLPTLQHTPTPTSTESSSSLSYQEVLSELRRYEVICREQSLQLTLLSNQLTDLKTVYNFEMVQNQQMWKTLIEKDQLVEYQRNLVIYLQRKILSMEYQHQGQQSQDHLNSNDAVVTSGSPKFRPEQNVQGTRTGTGTVADGTQHVDIPNRTDLMNVFCSHSDKNSYSSSPYALQRSGNYQAFGFSPHIFPADTISSSVAGLRGASHPFNNSSNDNSTHLMNRFRISPDHSSSSSDNINPWQQQFPNFQQFGNHSHVFSPDVISPPMSRRLTESVSQLHNNINEKNSDPRPVTLSRASNNRIENVSQEIEEMRSSLSYTDVTKAGIDDESDIEIDVVGAYSPSPIPFEHSDATSAPAVVSECATNGKSIESTNGTVGSNIPDQSFLSPVEEVTDYAFGPEITREPLEELRREIYSLLNDDNKNDQTEISSILLHDGSQPATHSAPSCHQIASKLVAAIEITPLKFSKCGTTLTYTSPPMTSPSTTSNIDLSSLNWKPFDETTVGCNKAEKGVPHASGYAIVKVDRIQHLPFRNAHPSNATDSSSRAKHKYKTKNPNANYVARIREEAFLENGQKVYNVDYMKMSKTSTYNPNSKIGKSSTFKFTAYTTADDQRGYLCFQQDVLFYLPEPKETRRGKLSFTNFDFEPYNLHD